VQLSHIRDTFLLILWENQGTMGTMRTDQNCQKRAETAEKTVPD